MAFSSPFGGNIQRPNAGELENLRAYQSAIVDIDVATETAMLTRNAMLMQSGTTALAMANTPPQSVLQLLA